MILLALVLLVSAPRSHKLTPDEIQEKDAKVTAYLAYVEGIVATARATKLESRTDFEYTYLDEKIIKAVENDVIKVGEESVVDKTFRKDLNQLEADFISLQWAMSSYDSEYAL